MKIAIVAPSFGQIGGPEIFTQNLANELSKKGIDVVLFAPGDWQTLIKHIPTIEKSLWNMKNFKKQSKKERVDLRITSQIKVLDYEKEFDLIHLNSQKYACMVAEKSKNLLF